MNSQKISVIGIGVSTKDLQNHSDLYHLFEFHSPHTESHYSVAVSDVRGIVFNLSIPTWNWGECSVLPICQKWEANWRATDWNGDNYQFSVISGWVLHFHNVKIYLNYCFAYKFIVYNSKIRQIYVDLAISALKRINTIDIMLQFGFNGCILTNRIW